MTTRVQVTAHDWPVQVVAADTHPDGSVQHKQLVIVQPHTVSVDHSLYCTDSRSLIITEMKLPKKD